MMSIDRRPVQQNYYPQQIPNIGIQFTNPFPSQTTSTSSAQLLPTTLGTDGSFPRQATSTSQSYALTGTSGLTDRLAPSYFSTDMFSQSADMKFANTYDSSHSMPESSAPSPTANAFPVTSLGPTIFDFASNPLNRMSVLANESRRMSTPSVPSSSFLGVELPRQRQNSMIDWRGMNASSNYSNMRHESFTDTIDSARGMVAMSQSARHRVRQDSQHSYYSTNHSNTSSISSNGSYQPYYGSMDSSATEISTGENAADCVSRTLPRPNGYVPGNAPLAGAQSMMSTFSSKITSSTQKKHRCKICDKRFTRPSSLLTHTYSHTGEKPFKCEVEGCGRNFSVVSNLRRHKKVHRNQQQTSAN